MTISTNSTYNLKVVLKETGIKPDVLRAWERRYGVPMPERTPGGHRLYSEHDIHMIKWLMARQDEGLSISRAVEMWRANIAGGNDPLVKQTWVVSTPELHLQEPNSAETSIDMIRSRWLAACLNFNEAAAEQVLTQAFSLYPVETVCTDVLQRAMVDIGGLWYENRASIQQEHFTSGLAMRRLDALLAASPAPTRGKTIIICCPENEWHAFTTLLLALFIRRRGFNVIYLGANVPSEHLVETVSSVRADLVVLASQQLITAASLQDAAALVSAQGTLVAFGGRIFAQHPQLASCIAGYYLGSRTEKAIEIIENLLTVQPKSVSPLAPSPAYMESLKVFTSTRAFIEAAINTEFIQKGMDAAYFETAHQFMGDNVISALQMGDMNYLDGEIDWLTVMVASYHVPQSAVYDYLEIYANAVRAKMGAHAGILLEWFDAQVKSGRETLK